MEAKWYRKAAEQGDAIAQNNLATMYYTGQGIRRHYVQAAKFCRKSAEQGSVPAQYSLGYMYAKGVGVPQDYVQAHKWFDLAATRGNKKATIRRDLYAKKMTQANISKARKQAREWLVKHRRGK